jgi:outer membrane protein assembly factor BamB/subtilisin family serine protease
MQLLLSATSAAAEDTSGQNAAAKIHPELVQLFHNAGGGQIRFLVGLGEQADAPGAARQANAKAAVSDPGTRRGQVKQAVVDSLRNTADRSQAQVLALVARLRAQGHITEIQPLWVVNALVVTGDKVAANQLAARAEVSTVQPDAMVKFTPPVPESGSADVATASQWNLDLIGAPQAWNLGFKGSGVVIASLDTGVDWTHPALKANFRGYDPAHPETPITAGNWLDLVSGQTTPYDDIGHGTHTTGTAVGYDLAQDKAVGVAPGAKWIAVKAFDAEGASYSLLLTAGQWLLAPTDGNGVAHPAWAPDIINNSWGGKPGVNEILHTMVQNWRAAGIFPVFAAGNKGSDAATVSPPGNYPESYAVAAVDSNKTLAWFSSRGPSPYAGVLKPDISAPGVSVYSSLPGNGYGTYDGTSMATPHVAGTAALVLSAAPTLTVAQLQQTITNTATPLTDYDYPSSPNYGYGVGLVNAYEAVRTVAHTGTLSGTVRDGATLQPVAATLTLQPSGAQATSRADTGSYAISLPAGTYTLTVAAYGYSTATYTVTIADQATTVRDVLLTSLPKGMLQGRVTDQATGSALPGAAVSLAEDPKVAPVLTDNDGHYSLQGLIGTYTVQVRATGYDMAQVTAGIAANATTTLDVALVKAFLKPDEWPQFRGGPGHTGYNDSILRPPLTKLWTAVQPSMGSFALPPIVAGGRVFVSDATTKQVYALDAATGATLWSRSVDGYDTPISSVYLDGQVVVVSDNANAYSFDATTGNPLWNLKLPDQYFARYAPATDGKQVYVSTTQGATSTLYALDHTGSIRWQNRVSAGTPAVGDGKVFAAGWGAATAYSADSGDQLWQWTCGCSTDYELNPIYSDGLVLFWGGVVRNTLYALDGTTGELRWQVTYATGEPAVWNGSVFVPVAGTKIARVKLETGEVLNTYGAGTTTAANKLSIANGVLYVGSLAAQDAQTGSVLFSYKSGSWSNAYFAPVIADNRVFILDGGKLTAFAAVSQPVEGTLIGLVTDAGTGAPLAGATVTLESTSRVATADHNGLYTLTGAAGAYTALVQAYGYQDLRLPVTLPATPTRLDFALQAEPRAAVTGRVTDAVTGTPIAGASLRVLEDYRTPVAASDANGDFRLETYSGTYTLRTRHPGYLTTTIPVTLPAGSDTPISVSLKPVYPRPEDWVSEFGRPDHRGQTDNLLAPPLTTVWTGPALMSETRPVVGDGRVFVLTADLMLRAFNLATGQELWSRLANSGGTSPAYDRNVVYVTDRDGLSAYVADTGDLLWSVNLYHSSTSSSPTAKDGRVFLVSNGTLYAEDGESGSLLWSRSVGGDNSSPAVVDGVVYMSGGGPKDYALDAATGELLWVRDGCGGCSSGGGQTSVVGEGLLLEVDFMTGNLNAIDVTTGLLRWKRGGTTGVPAIIDGIIYAGTGSNTLALDPANGNVFYTLPVTGRLAGANGYLYGNGVTAVKLSDQTVSGPYLSSGSAVIVAEDVVVAVTGTTGFTVLKPVNPVPPNGSIRGTVRGRGTPDGPLKATVSVAGRTVSSDGATGEFRLRVPVGTWTISVTADGWGTVSQPVTVDTNQTVTADFRLDPVPKGAVSGTVTDMVTGSPVAGAQLTVLEDPKVPAALTGADGAFRLDLAPGSYTVRAEAPGYRLATYPTVVASGVTTPAALSLFPGPAGDCPMDRCAPDRSGQSASLGRPPYAPSWVSGILPGWAFPVSQPAMARGKVFVGNRGGALVALNLQTGATVWSRNLDTVNNWSPGTPAYGDGKVFAGNGNGRLYAVDADTGSILWQAQLNDNSHGTATPAVYKDGKVYVAASGTVGTVYAFDATSGRKLWERGILTNTSAVVVAGGRVYAVAYGPRVYAFDAATGATVWMTDESDGWTGWEDSGLAYDRGVLLVRPKYKGTIRAYDAATGARLWEQPGGIPATAGGIVYDHSAGTLSARDLHTGNLLWTLPVSVNSATPTPVLTGNILLLGGVTAVDVEARQVVWTYSAGTTIQPVAGEGFLLLTDSSGYLIALKSSPTVGVAVAPELRTNAAGVTVTLSGNGQNKTARSTSDGLAVFTGVPAGTYTLTASGGFYLPDSHAYSIPAAGGIVGPLRPVPGDVNQDGVIDAADLLLLAGQWGTTSPALDMVPDGRIDLQDLYAAARGSGRHSP